MLTANATLAIFFMFGLSSLAVFWAKRVHLPHTVFLVAIGTVLGALTEFSQFHFLGDLRLTPELLFYLLLPTLIFESAYNINVRRLVEDTTPILVLAVISLLVSTVVIAGLLFGLFHFIGFPVPFIILLLFGALISATDPVAVLALFKEYGAPRRLSLIFEGESLFNDATAVALFLVLLGIVTSGFHGAESILDGLLTFSSMLIGGTIFGLIIGAIFVTLIGFTRESETATITLTIVLAHATFILSEIISHHVAIGGFAVELSPIISTTIASLVMGNYGRAKIHPRADEFVEKLWGQLAFMSNSLIFILIGILFADVPLVNIQILSIVLATILIVAFSRALSIYPVLAIFNSVAKPMQRIPRAWQHLLSWGSLRGALAVTMVLLIPPELTFASADGPIGVRDLLLTLTVGCIFATLFIKATTIQSFMKKLKLDTFTVLETIEYQEAKALLNHEITEKLSQYVSRGYIDDQIARTMRDTHEQAYQDACHKISELSKNGALTHRVIRLYAIGIERRHLKTLYHHNEVSEAVYRKLSGKLRLQFEAIEAGNLEPNMSLHTDGKDIFEHMASIVRRLVKEKTAEERIADLYMYYRAQSIISRKVLKELANSNDDHSTENIFTSEALQDTLTLYTNFKEQSKQKMNELATQHPDVTRPLAAKLAGCGIDKITETVLDQMQSRELITPKLYITLRNEVEEQVMT